MRIYGRIPYSLIEYKIREIFYEYQITPQYEWGDHKKSLGHFFEKYKINAISGNNVNIFEETFLSLRGKNKKELRKIYEDLLKVKVRC